MNKIYYCVIGEQKCGTTWLYKNLEGHPELYFVPNRKELRIFMHDRFDIFGENINKFKCGDITPCYFCQGEIYAKKIYEYNPDMKIIIMLRDPVDRAISQYLMQKRFKGDLYKVLKNMSFYDAFINDYPKDGMSIMKRSNYTTNLNNWLKYFKSDQIKIIMFDDIKNNPKKVLNEIHIFLGIKEYYNSNVNKIVRPYDIEYTEDRTQLCNKEQYDDLIKRCSSEMEKFK